MPRGDRTGPWGQGSRTGRGLGYCSGYSTPGYSKGSGMGYGRGFGGGRGWGGGGWGRGRRFHSGPYYLPSVQPFVNPPFPTPINPEDEAKYLEDSLIGLKKEIELIEERLEKLSEKKSKLD